MQFYLQTMKLNWPLKTHELEQKHQSTSTDNIIGTSEPAPNFLSNFSRSILLIRHPEQYARNASCSRQRHCIVEYREQVWRPLFWMRSGNVGTMLHIFVCFQIELCSFSTKWEMFGFCERSLVFFFSYSHNNLVKNKFHLLIGWGTHRGKLDCLRVEHNVVQDVGIPSNCTWPLWWGMAKSELAITGLWLNHTEETCARCSAAGL